MLIPIILGFAGSYAATFVFATLQHVNNPWAITLAIDTPLFAIIVFLTVRNRKGPD